MPTPSISNGSSTYTFIALDGNVQPVGLLLEDITRPAVHGHAFRELASHGDPFVLVGHRDVDDLAAAKTVYNAMVSAYAGKVVTIVDAMGSTHANIVCLRVERVDSFKVLTAVGGVSTSKGAMLVVRFTLQSSQ